MAPNIVYSDLSSVRACLLDALVRDSTPSNEKISEASPSSKKMTKLSGMQVVSDQEALPSSKHPVRTFERVVDRFPTFRADEFVSVAGSALGSPSPSADGPALSVAPNSAGGPVVVAASADGPAETSTTGTGRLLPSGTEGGLDVVLHCPPPAVEGPGAELVHQFFSDWSPGDGGQNDFSGLSASADMTGEQDGVGEDLLSQVRTLQDSAPGLLGCLELAFELLDPLVPLSKGLLEGRHLSTVYFVPVFGPGEEIGDRVGHLQGYGLAVEVDSLNADTSITGVVDPDPSRRGRFAGATSSASTPFSFSFPCLAARVSPWPPLGSEVCVAVKGSPVGTRASVLGASVLRSADLADPAFLDPKLIFFAGAGGRAETGKLLITPENQK
nr:hypothetical protein Iba_chr06eCG4920 [Ipomoea batatas]